jgi:hypothetical protein
MSSERKTGRVKWQKDEGRERESGERCSGVEAGLRMAIREWWRNDHRPDGRDQKWGDHRRQGNARPEEGGSDDR